MGRYSSIEMIVCFIQRGEKRSDSDAYHVSPDPGVYICIYIYRVIRVIRAIRGYD